MITKDEAVLKVQKYEAEQEKKRIAATDSIKQKTIQWCNNELSDCIANAADKGRTSIRIDAVNWGAAARECVSTVVHDTSGRYGYYRTVRSIHPTTMVKYLEEHGFTIDKANHQYDVSSTSSKNMQDGYEYTVKWA